VRDHNFQFPSTPVPDVRGCPCLPMDVSSVSVSIQVGSPENIRNSFGIVKNITIHQWDITSSSFLRRHSRYRRLPMSANGSSYGHGHFSTRQPPKHRNRHWNHLDLSLQCSESWIPVFPGPVPPVWISTSWMTMWCVNYTSIGFGILENTGVAVGILLMCQS